MDDEKKSLLDNVHNWLKSLGYGRLRFDPRGHLRVPGRFDSEQYEIIIRALDAINTEFRAPYMFLPEGEAAAVNKWIIRLLRRMWGGAAYGLVKCPEGDLIVVWTQLRTVENPRENKGNLYDKMRSIREYFTCWKSDITYAEDLSLKFGDIDATHVFCSDIYELSDGEAELDLK